MSLNLIKGALENKIISITPTISTAYEGVSFTPVVGVPYQEVYFMPAINEAQYINDKGYFAKGIFQITLSYPFGVGTNDIMARAQLYVNAFSMGEVLMNQGQKVTISDAPDVVRLGQSGDRYKVAVSVNYKAFVEVL
jgi:hypothetical protein